MSYNESDYITIIKKIEELLETKATNPLKTMFLIKKLLGYYKKFPVYPSLAVKMFENDAGSLVECQQLEKGDVIYTETEKESYLGTVKDISPETEGSIKLSDLSKTTGYKSKTFEKKSLVRICSLNPKPQVKSADNSVIKTEDKGVAANA